MTRTFNRRFASVAVAAVIAALSAVANENAGGECAYFSFGAYPVWECPPMGADVCGMRFSFLAGRHRNVTGLDMGVFANICDCSSSGVEFAGLCNVVGDSQWALQIAAVCNYSSHNSSGVQLALVNWGDEDIDGLQLGGINCAGMFGGCQVGVLNSVESGGGVQFGVVNVSDEFVGVQFGLINFNLSSGVPVLPIMNILF